MISRIFTYVPGFLITATLLTGCAGSRLDHQLARAKYWKRIDVTEVTYINGVHAQRTLNQDISTCVTDIRQQERMRALREAIPANIHGQADQYGENYPDELALNEWDTPERDGYLRAEHNDYHNFESCMYDKGWTRTEFVPYDTVQRAHKAFKKNIGYEDNEAAITPSQTNQRHNKYADNYDGLNE